jgi:protein TonB
VAKLSGQVVLHVVISKTGSVERAQVVSSTNSIFDQAAMDAVQQWTYRPYRLNGDPIEVDSTVTINFQLRPPTNSESPPGQ